MELVDIDALVKRLAQKDIIFMFDHSDETGLENLKKLSKLLQLSMELPVKTFWGSRKYKRLLSQDKLPCTTAEKNSNSPTRKLALFSIKIIPQS